MFGYFLIDQILQYITVYFVERKTSYENFDFKCRCRVFKYELDHPNTYIGLAEIIQFTSLHIGRLNDYSCFEFDLHP